jgi:hypothetical protein
MKSNAFNIKTPQIYRAHVYRYHSKLSRLYVRAFKEDAKEPAFYLLFSDVAYFEGPMNWQGVHFHIAPPQESLTLMQKSGILMDAPPEMLQAIAEVTHLYILDSPPTTVKIIAGHAARLNEIPPEL